MKRRRFAPALSIFLLLAASAPAPAAGPVDPKTKKPFEDTADSRATRGSEMATLYAEASRALAAQVSAAQAQEAASKRPLVLQTFTQATSGPAGRRGTLQSEAIRIREKLKTASPAERDALAKRVSDMLTEARQLPKQVHLYHP